MKREFFLFSGFYTPFTESSRGILYEQHSFMFRFSLRSKLKAKNLSLSGLQSCMNCLASAHLLSPSILSLLRSGSLAFRCTNSFTSDWAELKLDASNINLKMEIVRNTDNLCVYWKDTCNELTSSNKNLD